MCFLEMHEKKLFLQMSLFSLFVLLRLTCIFEYSQFFSRFEQKFRNGFLSIKMMLELVLKGSECGIVNGKHTGPIMLMPHQF